MGGLNLYNETEVVNMEKDFTKTSIEYNLGFIDCLLWVAENKDKIDFEMMMSMVENILKANDDIMNDEEKRFEQLNQFLKTK